MTEQITSVGGADVARVFERSSAGSGNLTDLGREFAALLAQPPAQHPVPEVGSETALGKIVHDHEKLYLGFVKDLRSAASDVQGMSMQQASMKQVEMMFRAAEVHMQHTAFSSVSQGTKNGMQTLIKNQ